MPIVGISALNGRGMDRLMPTVFETYKIWNKRVPTPKLNRWLRRWKCCIRRRADPPHHAQAEEPLREPRQVPPVRAVTCIGTSCRILA
ncbi:MAG: hypothetical protein ACHQPH_19830 [Reyranellales bacterium]